jgi:hypothetical protein
MLEGGVEDVDEYEMSKDLLFAYINSSTVIRVCDGATQLVQWVKMFVRDYMSMINTFCITRG